MRVRHARFVEEYLVDLNATKAAMRAGYSAKTAHVQACGLLKRPDIAQAIRDAESKKLEKTKLSQAWVLDRLQQEAERVGEGSSHSARVQALKHLGDHLGMFGDRPTLEVLLASLPGELAEELRRAILEHLSRRPIAGGGRLRAVPNIAH